MKNILVVGAGFAGAVLAREIAEAGHNVTVIDRRDHIGGNAFDFVNDTGERVHKMGPHLLHGSRDSVAIRWLSRFTEWIPYEHRVKAQLSSFPFGEVPLPVNATTMEHVFSTKFDSEDDAKGFLHSLQIPIQHPHNSYEVFVSSVGEKLASIFFLPYTKKMWGMDAREIEAAVGARIPVRFNRDDRYFTDDFQAMPKDGYTPMFERILSHPNIEVRVATPYEKGMEAEFDHMFTAAPIDSFFDYKHGKLPYRSIKFHVETTDKNQSATTINFTDTGRFTRKTQWDLIPNSGKSTSGHHTVTYEEPCDPSEVGGECFYPVRNAASLELFQCYAEDAAKLPNVTFCGRTGCFIYEDMVPSVTRHLQMAKKFIASCA